jgi:hypothetical protein
MLLAIARVPMSPSPQPSPPFRCGTTASQASIARILNLPEPGKMEQDWEICSADPARVGEFVTAYESYPSLTDDERFTLMELIVASFDELLQNGSDGDDLASAIRGAIVSNFELHACTVYYWCLWNRGCTPPADEMFAVTPLMRDIWLSRGESE